MLILAAKLGKSADSFMNPLVTVDLLATRGLASTWWRNGTDRVVCQYAVNRSLEMSVSTSRYEAQPPSNVHAALLTCALSLGSSRGLNGPDKTVGLG